MRIFVTSAYQNSEPISTFRAMAELRRRHELASTPEDADAILFVEASHYLDDPFFEELGANHILRQYRERCFVYSEHDLPWPKYPGLYCSLPRQCFDANRHATTRFIRLLNPVEPTGQTDLLFSFMGQCRIPVRKRIMLLKHPRGIVADSSSFNPFYADKVMPQHLQFADLMRRSKFAICPRGAGAGSIRLFETLRAERVPIIVADDWVEPEGIDWPSFSIRVKEADVLRIPQIAEEQEHRWEAMAHAARRVWDEHFDDAVYFDCVGDTLAELLARRKRSEAVSQRMPSVAELSWKARVYANRIVSPSMLATLRNLRRGKSR